MYLTNSYSHKGFTLVEVMVALVVMAIGMLGLASIQAVGMQNNKTAYNRTLAMQAAYNMADIMRSHKNTEGVVTATFDDVDSTVAGSTPSCIINTTTSCSTTDMALADIYQWQTRLEQLLPSGRGTVEFDSGTSLYEIKVMWDEDRKGVTGEDCTDADDLKCYVINVQI